MRRWLIAGTTAGAAGLVVADRAAKRRFGRPRRRPNRHEVPTGAADVSLTAVDGSTLRGWWLGSADGATGPAALVIHGWGGSAADMIPVADPLLRLGLHVLLLDARGHGRSDDVAVASMPSFADDVRAGMRWLRTRPEVDPTGVVLVGHSVGAGACLYAASDDPDTAAVIALASMADPRVFMRGQLQRVLPRPLATLALRYVEHTIGRRFEEFVPVATIAGIHAPVLLLHGAQDTTVPVADAYRLHALAPANTTLRVIDDADHFSVEALDRAGPVLAQFLAGALTPSR